MLTIKNRPLRSKVQKERSIKFNKYWYYYNLIGYRIWRSRRQIRFLFLSLISSISLFLYESNYHLALADDDGDGGEGAGSCVGFLCGAIGRIVAAPPYDANAEMIWAVFIGVQGIIVAYLVWRVAKVAQARDAGEEYQGIASNAILTIVALLIVNYFADYIMGVAPAEG